MIIYTYVLYLSKRGIRLIKYAQDLDRVGGGPKHFLIFLLQSFNQICLEETKMDFNPLNI